MDLMILATITGLIMQAIKMALDGRLNRFLPLLSILLAVTLGYFYKVDFVDSILAGAAASGGYDLVTKTVKGETRK